MNTFLAIYKRHSFDIDISVFNDYLIPGSTKTKVWKSKDDRVLILGYTVRPKAETQDFVSEQDSALTFEGFPLIDTHGQGTESYETELLNCIQATWLSCLR